MDKFKLSFNKVCIIGAIIFCIIALILRSILGESNVWDFIIINSMAGGLIIVIFHRAALIWVSAFKEIQEGEQGFLLVGSLFLLVALNVLFFGGTYSLLFRGQLMALPPEPTISIGDKLMALIPVPGGISKGIWYSLVFSSSFWGAIITCVMGGLVIHPIYVYFGLRYYKHKAIQKRLDEMHEQLNKWNTEGYDVPTFADFIKQASKK